MFDEERWGRGQKKEKERASEGEWERGEREKKGGGGGRKGGERKGRLCCGVKVKRKSKR
ncbi:MAG: hypothetical protein ACKESB_02500 [Candidatus Hodgkinia cicadicola]